MDAAPNLALVLKSTFFEVVAGPQDQHQPRPRRAASLPGTRAEARARSGAGAPSGPLYVSDTGGCAWTKVTEDELPPMDQPLVRIRCQTSPDLVATAAAAAAVPPPRAGCAERRRARPATLESGFWGKDAVEAVQQHGDGELSSPTSLDDLASCSCLSTDAPTTVPPSPAESATSGGTSASAEACPEEACGGKEEQLRTTVMIRNLPNTLSRERLRALLDAQGYAGKYNFVYVPTDFKTSAGLGFAFVNFLAPEDAQAFRAQFTGFRDWGVPTGKICNVSWANPDQQGLEANIERYRNSSVMHRSVAEEYKPLILVRGVPTKFPKNTKRLWPPHANFGVRATKSGK